MASTEVAHLGSLCPPASDSLGEWSAVNRSIFILTSSTYSRGLGSSLASEIVPMSQNHIGACEYPFTKRQCKNYLHRAIAHHSWLITTRNTKLYCMKIIVLYFRNLCVSGASIPPHTSSFRRWNTTTVASLTSSILKMLTKAFARGLKTVSSLYGTSKDECSCNNC